MATALPLDPNLTLFAMSDARPQIKNQETGEIAIDLETGAKVYQIDAGLSIPGGRPMAVQLNIPEPGLSEEVVTGTMFHAVGLICLFGEKNGRVWQIFRAAGVAPLLIQATKAA
jgi:hypothetical protein